jgi:hypothetical protein
VRKKGFEPPQAPLKCPSFNFAFADCRQTPCTLGKIQNIEIVAKNKLESDLFKGS